MQLEQFEQRNLMASSYALLTTEGTWQGKDCSDFRYYAAGSSCQTTSPVKIDTAQVLGSTENYNVLKAPDGGKVVGNVDYGGGPSNNTFFPNNGLLTVETGQTNRSFGVQQEILVAPRTYFPTDVVQNPTDKDAISYQTSIKVAVSGDYTLYWRIDEASLSSRNDSTVSIADKSLSANDLAQSQQVTVSLVAGTEYPVAVKFYRSGSIDRTFSLDWSGPGLTRQTFTPTSDVTWQVNFPDFRARESGFLSVGATIDVRKRTEDSNYAMRFSTTFTVPTTGSYSFFVTTVDPATSSLASYEDAANLRLGSDVVVNKDKTVASATGSRTLTAGTVVTLEVNYLRRMTGYFLLGNNLKVEWSGPGLARSEFKPVNPVKYRYFQPNNNRFFLEDFASLATQFPANPSALDRVLAKEITLYDPKSFALSWRGQTTSVLPVGSSADEVKKALTALSNIGAAGGSVAVVQSKDGGKYNVTFGGNITYKPPLITGAGSDRIVTNPVTTVAITKREENSTLKVISTLTGERWGSSTNVEATLPNGSTFPITNAPSFTPTQVSGNSLRGYLELPTVAGIFEPASQPGDSKYYNVFKSRDGLKVFNGSLLGDTRPYLLNAQTGSNGVPRPISFLKIGGLEFQAPAGTKVDLAVGNGDNDAYQFISAETSMLVTAPFEGGRLTLRLKGNGLNPLFNANANPIFTVSLETGALKVTSDIELVSFEIGGVVIPASDNFKMTYDRAADKFTFAFNNLNIGTTIPTGEVKASDARQFGADFVQSFDIPGITVAGSSYESAKFTPIGNRKEFQSIAEFDGIANKLKGTLPFDNAFQFRPGLVNDGNAFGARYKASFTVASTGTYTFSTASGFNTTNSLRGPIQRLKINDTVVLTADSYNAFPTSTSIQLTQGTVYTLEFTVLHTAMSQLLSEKNLVFVSGRNWPYLNLGDSVLNAVVTSPVSRSQNFYSRTSDDFVGNIRNAAYAVIDSQSQLTDQERKQFKSQVQVSFQQGKLTVTGMPFLLSVETTIRRTAFNEGTFDRNLWEPTYGTVSNPVRFTMRSGSLTLANGVLSPLSNISVDSFSIGRTTINQFNEFQTEFEPLQPAAGGSFKLSFFNRNIYSKDGTVAVPGNSFGIYGSETQLPLEVGGVRLGGKADLGTELSPGLLVTNGQFNRLTYSIPDVTIDGLVFKATNVGSAKPLSVNYFPPQGINPKSYVVLGGAVLKAGGTIKSDMKVNFGGQGSDGLRIFPAKGTTPASFTFSFGVAEIFLAGTQAIESAEGLSGLNLLYDQKVKSYTFRGNAFLDFNPTRPHTPTDLVFTGTKLAVSANVPDGVLNFPANRLDSNTLNFFFSKDSSINGFQFSPRPTSNPLRVTITSNNGVATDTVGGAFTMRLDGANLYGVMDTTSFTNATFPTTGYILDFSPLPGLASGFALAGVTMDDAKKATLTKTLSIKFPVARFDGNVIAQGAVGSEAAIVEANEGKITKAEFASPVARVIGDFNFQNYKATYSNTSSSKLWTFVGPANYLGKQVNVGTPAAGNPQLKIGGDPRLGFQLQTISKPVELITPDFKLPSSIEIAGLNFDTALLPQDAPVLDQGALGKVYSVRSQNYGVKLGNTTLSLSVGAKIRVSSAGVAVESFSATGVQNSAFTIGNATLQIKAIAVEYIVATKTLQISGDAKFTFKAKAANVDMNVTLGTKANPGLIIRSGSVESFQVSVTGTFELLKLSIASEKLTVEYKKENQEFAIYGDIKLSTSPQAGVQVIKDLAVSLGSKDKPGIKIVSGSLESLDISINGEINLFKITASPKDLHVSYSAAKNQLQITGELVITLAPKLELTAALPGDGLLIDTSTGKVQVRGLSLAAKGDIKFGTMTIKGLKVEYAEDDAGEVSIGAAAEIQLPSGLAVGGSFKIINGKLDAIGISFEKNPGILVANGLVNIYRIEASVEGLTNLDNFKISGTVKATVGPLVKFGGESYALADVTGTINITPKYLELLGDVQLVGGKFGNGKFAGKLLWSPAADDQNPNPRVTFEAEVNLYPGDIVRGKIVAYADIKGNVDFNADMGVFIPQQVPLAGGVSLGRLQVELRVRPAEEPTASYAKFGFSDIAVTAFKVPTFHGSVRIGFDKIVDYNFGARFFIPLPWPLPDIDYSIDVGGKFEIRDASNNPTVQILAASSLTGTPDGEILFSASTPLPDDTIIDIYADNDNLENDGYLIGSSIPYRDGTQTFVWRNMAAFAKPGEPVYVYAVINDSKHAKGYSDYSPRFNVAPGFVPSITAPSVLNFAAGDIAVFSKTFGNAIVVADPRSNRDAASEVEVVLNVGGGTVDLSHAPDEVRYSGEGTSRMTLRGTAAAINAALDGLRYAQRFASSSTDNLEITVNNLPLENVNGGVKASVLLDPNPLKLSLLPSQDSEAPNTITIGRSDETPLQNIQIDSLRSNYVTSAKVAIAGYERGKDLLTLPLDEESSTGVDGAFDADTGIMTLTGFEWIEDYEQALRSIVFTTKSANSGKSLTVTLADDDGEKSQVTVPLTLVAGHAAPQLSLNSSGISYLVGVSETAIAPEGTIDVASGSRINSLTISFEEGSYIVGEDKLVYTGSTMTGVFDSVTGKLSLSGQGTAADWSQALQQVKYASIGSTFTEGNRYLKVTVADNGLENSIADALLVIDKTLAAESHSSPVLSLSTNDLNLPAHEDFVILDGGLTLTASSPMLLGATVAITGNYIAGEDELGVTSIWDGLTVDFNSQTGVLTISGLATVFEYEDVLRSVIFIDSAGYRTPGPAEITYTVNDGLSTSEVERLQIEIAAAPFVESDLDRILFYDGGQTADPINDGFAIQHSGSLSGAIVSIAGGFMPGEDVLVFENSNGISGVYDSATGVLRLSGTASAAQYASALGTVRYKNTRFNPSAGERVIDFQVLDANSISNHTQSLIVVDANVVPPQVTFAAPASYTEDGSPVEIAPNFTLTARDATTTFLSPQEVLYGAEIAIINYRQGEDLLALVGDSGNIDGSFDPIEGRIYLTGEATFDEYEAAIRSIVYSNSSEVPTTEPRQISIRLLDSGASGLNNQAITTQVIVGLPDPVTLVSGSVDDVGLLENDDSVQLGLDDLVFSSPDLTHDPSELVFTATTLPSDKIGFVVLSDGTRLQANTRYSIAQLQGLQFEPRLGGIGQTTFVFSVALSDSESGNLDLGSLTKTVTIKVDGIATSTSSEALVAQMFRDLLGKNPDSATLNNLTTQLNQKLNRVGRQSNGYFDEADARASFILDFANSELVRKDRINELYQSILGRVPSTTEVSARLSELSSGKTLDEVRFALLASDEFFQSQNSSFEVYVNHVYPLLLNREPTNSETSRWVRLLNNGRSRLLVVSEIGSWANVDSDAREAIVAELLQRDATISDEQNFDFTSRDALIRSVVASDEYFLRFFLPTNTSRVLTQTTSDYASVGKLGDINGDKAGGTLIAPQFVLVAAHSVAGIPPGQITFTIGGSQYRIERVYVNPGFDSESLGTDFGNDIAILKLTQSVQGITPSVLSGKSPRLGDVLKLVGFGQEDGSAYGTKRVGSTPAVDNLGTSVFRWTHTSDIQNDSDPGDSGSPLFATVDGAEQVIGIVSGGTSASGELGDVATNTRVDKYLDWIRSIVPTVTVADSVDPPTMQLGDTELTIDENAGQQTIPFTVWADGDVGLSIESNNASLFSELRFDWNGSSEGRILFHTATNARGTAKIILTATSGTTSKAETITLSVEERNDQPTIDRVPIQIIEASTSPKTIALTGISPGVGEQGQVRMALFSALPTSFFATTGIVHVPGAANATLNYTPSAHATGGGTIVLELRDPGSDGNYYTSDDGIRLESVQIVLNNLPTLNTIENRRILASAGEQSIPLTGISSGETPSQSLSITAVSSNLGATGPLTIVYDPTTNAATGTLKFTPIATGSSIITVTLRDVGNDGLVGTEDDGVTTRTFRVDVVDSLNPWQNPTNPMDVNGDNILGIDDVLTIINAINLNLDGTLPDRTTAAPPFYDVNGNGILEPLDALIIINEINRESAGEGELAMPSVAEASVDRWFEAIGSQKGQPEDPMQTWLSESDWLVMDSNQLANGTIANSRNGTHRRRGR